MTDQTAEAFEQWKANVDRELEKLVGLTSDDLPDVDYWQMFWAHTRPSVAARRVIRNARDY